jgi:hypothetical protein
MRMLIAAAAAVALASPASAATVFSASGATAADIQGTVDAFRAAIGANNGNLVGSQGAGRREINWDGGGAGAPATVFGNPMTTFAFRGATFTNDGAGFEISGQPTPEFGDINPTYPGIFSPFSGARIFAPLGSTFTDVRFNVPGSVGQRAYTTAFGAVFLDVDRGSTSGLAFFDLDDHIIGTIAAQKFDNGFSFLGVSFDPTRIGRVRVVTGNTPLGGADGGDSDVVALDDFIFAEPTAVPEPTTWGLMILGFGGMGAILRIRRLAAA